MFRTLRRMAIEVIYHTSLAAFVPLIKKSLMDTEGTKSVSAACKGKLRLNLTDLSIT
jgi:hypothetical protein